MKAKTNLPAKFAELGPIEEPTSIQCHHQDWQISLSIVCNDQLAVRLKQITFLRTGTPQVTLSEFAHHLSERVHALMESLVLIEVDNRLKGAFLRSAVPEDGEYFEVRLHDVVHLSLSRYAATPGKHRQMIDFTMTYDTLDRLVHEIVNAAH